MGAKIQCLNPRLNLPNNHTTPSFPVLRSHPTPLLPQLGLPTASLSPRLRRFAASPLEVGFLSIPQKGVKIWAPSHLLAVQVSISAAAATGTGQGSGGSTVG
ncbi:Hypothetical predicted protein [Olea europaea subsp. europaea]|uniref:Uncharacterized protein n=1 Tax=Olea europaea subsp. europaea TaxID=158383 RepID=A0A8S0RZJ6_OLEEU|nr:Hypothetical predicted protein [Olea europaea subsp. europaea]